jgi:type VI secretion system secreted protein VgrG
MATFHGVTAEIDIDGASYRVRRARVKEAMSEVPVASFELANDDGAPPDPATLLRKDVTLTIADSESSADPRHFRGVVIDASRSTDNDGERFRMTAAPKLWRLMKRRDSRIYQDESALDVALAVLKDAGVTDIQQRLRGTFAKRVYITQYRETDLEFVLRLFSEEGVTFRYDFSEKELLVLTDDPKGLDDAPEKELKYQPAVGFELPPKSVTNVRQTHWIKSDKTYVRDYDFERPKHQVEGKSEGTDAGTHALEVYEYPARIVDDAVTKTRAKVLLDSIQCGRDLVEGISTSLGLSAGLRFSVSDHPYAPLNQEYLVVSHVLDFRVREPLGDLGGGAVQLESKWVGMPTATSAYRPPRRERASHVAGIQVAVTTGPPGQEIHTDKYGRVKVHFPWDRKGKRDDTSSLWMRTSQLATGGSMLLPRVGWEVIVEANEGDPDQLFVMGRVYNAEKTPPYSLPNHKARGAIQTATTPGGGSVNEIRTDDTKGKEEMFINASRDAAIKVNNNATETVKVNETRTIGSNQTIEVTNSDGLVIGGNQSLDVAGNQDVSVSTFMVDDVGGAISLTIGGNRDMKIGGDHRVTVGANSSLSVGTTCSGLVVGKVCEKVGGNEKLDVSAVRAAITAADHSTSIGGNHTEEDGALKVTIAFGGKSVSVSGSLRNMIGGAVLAKVDGDRSESAGASFTEVAAGASIIKADTVTFEAETTLAVVMGASIVALTPASASILGTSIKIDGEVTDEAALILDN